MVATLTTAAVAATALTLASPAAAEQKRTVEVAHGPVSANGVVPVEAGKASPGDLRTYYTPLTTPGGKKRIGFMTGSLVTTAVNLPEAGKEYRESNLVFTVRGSQLVIGGVAAYDQQAAVLPKKSSVVRPVIGGTGRYAGAHGWARSTRFADNTWRHTFRIWIG